MMKNRAGLLALLVLVIATILMVFFVLPHIGGDKKPIGDAINQASSQVGNIIADNTPKPADTASKPADTTAEPSAAVPANPLTAADIAARLGSLKDMATTSLAELKALFADGKGPTTDVFEAAKTKTVNSLQAIVDLAKPDNAEPATATLIDTAHQSAGKALDIIKALPENIADAVAAIDRARAILLGNPTPQPEAPAGPAKPTFDVLRVEPDGSTVIAGRAQPDSKLEILDGDKVINSTQVGPGGDFAAVLDDPLPAGDHQIILKATGKDGKATVSDEIATVSIPKDGSSQLLAMVTKPGEASRIMTAPEAKQSRVTTPAGQPATPAAPSSTAAASTATQDAANANPSAAASASASPAPDADASTATGEPAGIVVSAVEIENDHLFVAGATRANLKVRAYADDKQIGDSTASTDGHFVVDGPMPLSVGDHKIRVDGLDASGKVILRTAVNFNRPEGNQLTVAAQSPAQAATAAPTAALDEGQLGKLRSDIGRAFDLLKNLFANGQLPSDEQLAAARSGTEFALKSLSDFRPAIDASAALKQAAAAASNGAGKALAFLQSLPRDPKSVGAALARLDRMISPLLKPAAGAAATAAPASADASGVKTYEQTPLAVNNNAVIIRHGDTLWQISRRTYGLGVRYTTIYLANEDQINNPDRILPGQVFGLPKDALPNSEELHRQRMSGKHL
jgi:nucleoid-associated protein YgaU